MTETTFSNSLMRALLIGFLSLSACAKETPEPKPKVQWRYYENHFEMGTTTSIISAASNVLKNDSEVSHQIELWISCRPLEPWTATLTNVVSLSDVDATNVSRFLTASDVRIVSSIDLVRDNPIDQNWLLNQFSLTTNSAETVLSALNHDQFGGSIEFVFDELPEEFPFTKLRVEIPREGYFAAYSKARRRCS